MDRREALEMALSLAPEASAEAHVVYAAYLEGSGAVEASEGSVPVGMGVLRDAPLGALALDKGGYVWEKVGGGEWTCYGRSDGEHLVTAPAENIVKFNLEVIGYVRPFSNVPAVPVIGEDWTDTAAVGAIALVGDAMSYVREEDGWHFYSPDDGYRYSSSDSISGWEAHFVGYVRNVNPFVGQYVLEANEEQYSVGTVALDGGRDVWYYLGGDEWGMYEHTVGASCGVSTTSTVVLWNAVIVA